MEKNKRLKMFVEIPGTGNDKFPSALMKRDSSPIMTIKFSRKKFIVYKHIGSDTCVKQAQIIIQTGDIIYNYLKIRKQKTFQKKALFDSGISKSSNINSPFLEIRFS